MRAENQNRRKRNKRLPSVLLAEGLPMLSQQNLFGLVDLRGEVGRAPLIGMQLLHQRAVRPADVLFARPRRKAKNLIGLLLGHLAATARSGPRRRTLLRVLTPAGLPAVKISGQ
jgi:hypothetical protein